MPGIEARAPERTETSSGRSGSPKPRADRLLDAGQRVGDLRLQIGRVGLAVGVETGADLGRDREARRHRQAEIAHLGQVGALAAEQVAHLGAPLGARRRQSGRPICVIGAVAFAALPLDLREIGDLVHHRANARQADAAGFPAAPDRPH